jgi:RNase P/RNase MRP subunit p29
VNSTVYNFKLSSDLAGMTVNLVDTSKVVVGGYYGGVDDCTAHFVKIDKKSPISELVVKNHCCWMWWQYLRNETSWPCILLQ